MTSRVFALFRAEPSDEFVILQECYKTLDIVKGTTISSGAFIKVCVIKSSIRSDRA